MQKCKAYVKINNSDLKFILKSYFNTYNFNIIETSKYRNNKMVEAFKIFPLKTNLFNNPVV